MTHELAIMPRSIRIQVPAGEESGAIITERLTYGRGVGARLWETVWNDHFYRRGAAAAGVVPLGAVAVLAPPVGCAALGTYAAAHVAYQAHVLTRGTRRRFYEDRARVMARMTDAARTQSAEQLAASLAALHAHRDALTAGDAGLQALHARTQDAVATKLEQHAAAAHIGYVHAVNLLCLDLLKDDPILAAAEIAARLGAVEHIFGGLPTPRPAWVHQLRSFAITFGGAFAAIAPATPASAPR